VSAVRARLIYRLVTAAAVSLSRSGSFVPSNRVYTQVLDFSALSQLTPLLWSIRR